MDGHHLLSASSSWADDSNAKRGATSEYNAGGMVPKVRVAKPLTDSVREEAVRTEYGRILPTTSDIYRFPVDKEERERLGKFTGLASVRRHQYPLLAPRATAHTPC